jgi:hypothetical protein
MLADALGDRFLTSPFSRLAFIFSFPMALLSLIGVWGVPNLCHNLRVVERRDAPVWPAVKQFKDPFALISRAASGPLLPFITASKCCGAARQTGHSLQLQNLRGANSQTAGLFCRSVSGLR